jgi:hypothetical protein
VSIAACKPRAALLEAAAELEVACPVGNAGPGCSACPERTYSLAGASSCTPCPPGTWSPSASVGPDACAPAAALLETRSYRSRMQKVLDLMN